MNIFYLATAGSVLSPLLYVMYINDIDDYVGSRILKFADDTKINNKVNSVEDIKKIYEQTWVN